MLYVYSPVGWVRRWFKCVWYCLMRLEGLLFGKTESPVFPEHTPERIDPKLILKPKRRKVLLSRAWQYSNAGIESDVSRGNLDLCHNISMHFKSKCTLTEARKQLKKGGFLTLPHLFAFDNFFELPLDPLDRDVGHGCVCRSAAACKEDPGPLSLRVPCV